MSKIGSQDGIKAAVNRLRDLDPQGTLLRKSGGSWPEISTLPSDLSQWKAWDKLQRTLQILKEDHDADTDQDYRPVTDLSSAQRRMFLAESPLDCLQAPNYMVPVCTADLGYRQFYDQSVVQQLRNRFGLVESWCDCRNPTAYSEALKMSSDFHLDGVWGQCENQTEFDHAYGSGARRMVGNVGELNSWAKDLVSKAEVLLTVELYRNLMPWMYPDWMGCEQGIGGNCIACYESTAEGAIYTSVANYKSLGLYNSGADSVYAVGLRPEDWKNL